MKFFSKIKSFKDNESDFICVLKSSEDSMLPRELIHHISIVPFGFFPLSNMPERLIPDFLIERNKHAEILKDNLKKCIKSGEENLENCKQNPFDRTKMPYLKPFEDMSKKEIAKFKLNRIEFFFSEIVRTDINKEKLRRLEVEIPDKFFDYIRFVKPANPKEFEYFIFYQENLCVDDMFVYLKELPDKFKPIVEQIKNDLRYYNHHLYISKNKISLPLPPDELLEYIDYTYCDILTKDNIPADLILIFNKYKEEFDKIKNKYLDLRNFQK